MIESKVERDERTQGMPDQIDWSFYPQLRQRLIQQRAFEFYRVSSRQRLPRLSARDIQDLHADHSKFPGEQRDVRIELGHAARSAPSITSGGPAPSTNTRFGMSSCAADWARAVAATERAKKAVYRGRLIFDLLTRKHSIDRPEPRAQWSSQVRRSLYLLRSFSQASFSAVTNASAALTFTSGSTPVIAQSLSENGFTGLCSGIPTAK